MLSRLVITFLPRSKHHLISWLQSPSAVILELKKIKSDTVSSSISYEVMGPDAMIYWTPSNLRTHLPVTYLLPFHIVHGVLSAEILKWFAIPSFSEPHFVRTLHHDPYVLGGPAHHDS